MKNTDLLEQLSQGCILRKKRWSGDTFIEFPDGEIDSAATDTMIERAHEAITRLRAELAEARKCVNALAGIADPEAFVSDVKTLLHAIDVAGIHPTTDVVALRNRIASMLPQENPNG